MADQVVPGHLETWWHRARAGDPDGDPIPAHFEREFRQYLPGGILAHGANRPSNRRRNSNLSRP